MLIKHKSRCTSAEKKGLWYTIFTFILFFLLTAVITFSITAHNKKEYYTVNGTITNVICTRDEGMYSIQDIILYISYMINNTVYDVTYETLDFQDCIPQPVYNISAKCCDNIIGNVVYLGFKDKDEINYVSTKNNHYSSLYITLAIIFSIIFCLTCSTCTILIRCESGYYHRKIFHDNYNQI